MGNHVSTLATASALTLLLGACSSLDRIPEYFSKLPETDSGTTVTEAFNLKGPKYKETRLAHKDIDFTTHINLIDGWSSEQRAFNGYLDDLYMKVEIKGYIPELGVGHDGKGTVKTSVRSYTKERAGAERIFVDKSRSLTFVLNVDVDGEIPFSVAAPLMGISYHESKDDVETWDTDIKNSARMSPLFRVGANSRITVGAKLKMAENVTSSAAKALLGLTTDIARVVVPQSWVVTTLTGSKLRDIAQTIDSAINNMFSLQIEERRSTSHDVGDWDPQSGMLATVHFPDPRDAKKAYHLGSWMVSLSKPRLSIFAKREFDCRPSTASQAAQPSLPASGASLTVTGVAGRTDQCGPAAQREHAKAIFAGVSSAQILKQAVAENVSIQQYLLQQEWFAQAMGESNNAIGTEDKARAFCDQVTRTLYGVGLNKYDALAGLWAVISSMPLSQAVTKRLKESCTISLGQAACFMSQNLGFREEFTRKGVSCPN